MNSEKPSEELEPESLLPADGSEWPDAQIRDHSAFLNGYSPEDEGLYDLPKEPTATDRSSEQGADGKENRGHARQT